jgi:arsenical pump membrane protein
MVVSNPMNMIVADYANIGFNEYALRMLPVAIPGWLIGYLVLRWFFARRLRADAHAAPPAPQTRDPQLSRPQLAMVAIVVSALPGYSLASLLGAPVWPIAALGAAAALAIAARAGARPLAVIARGVSWNTLAFLFCVLILALGLANVGLLDALAGHYRGAGVAEIGVTSAIGSALLNNHPMAYLNMLALESGHGSTEVLAALIGGDLGPRLLPMGSLAGLLWLEALRRRGVDISLGLFVTVGLAVTVPTLAVSLGVLGLLS